MQTLSPVLTVILNLGELQVSACEVEQTSIIIVMSEGKQVLVGWLTSEVLSEAVSTSAVHSVFHFLLLIACGSPVHS